MYKSIENIFRYTANSERDAMCIGEVLLGRAKERRIYAGVVNDERVPVP